MMIESEVDYINIGLEKVCNSTNQTMTLRQMTSNLLALDRLA